MKDMWRGKGGLALAKGRQQSGGAWLGVAGAVAVILFGVAGPFAGRSGDAAETAAVRSAGRVREAVPSIADRSVADRSVADRSVADRSVGDKEARQRPSGRSGGRIVGAVRAQGKWLHPRGRVAVLREAHLWTARCIYSETNRPEEQRLVAWVVRNRVETAFRGAVSYRDAVLDPYQFTPFNKGQRFRDYYLWLHPGADVPGWREALRIAVAVLSAGGEERPFPPDTRHFFSQVSMPGRHWPDWAVGRRPVKVQARFEPVPRRFRFFAGVGARE